MPGAGLLLPPAVLAAAGLASWILSAAGRRAAWPAAAGAWLALAAVAVIWIASGARVLELTPAPLTALIPADLRLDSVAVAISVAILLPFAFLVSFQPRSAAGAGFASLAAAAALVAVEASSLLLAVAALGSCLSLLMVALRREDAGAGDRFWAQLMAGWLLLVWAAAALEASAATTTYSAVPVSALKVPGFLLLAAGALVVSGWLPASAWVTEVWTGPGSGSGQIAVAMLFPIGFYLLIRAYGMGGGHWPSPLLNSALAALGVLTALAAAARAQAAGSRDRFLSESVTVSGGLALTAVALGTAVGLAAAITIVLGTALVIGIAPLLPAGARMVSRAALLAAAGLPPVLGFGGRLLAVQAAFEAGDLAALLGLGAALAWLLGLAAATRAFRLPGGGPPGRSGPAAAGLGLALAGGLALGALESRLALPAAAEVLSLRSSPLTGGLTGISTAAGGWPALTLAVPLLAALALAALVSARDRVVAAEPDHRPVVDGVPPLIGMPRPQVLRRPPPGTAGRVPDEYRSLFDPRALERAMTYPRPWLWVALVVAMAIAVNR